MPELNIDGLPTSYIRQGRGNTLILLHGILQDWRSWSRQINDLSADFDVIVPDLPGCGHSGDPPESYRTQDYGRWLAAFLESMGSGPAHVCGLSWGGMLAIELYRQRPDLVRSLILTGAYAGWKGSLPPETVAERLDQCLLESEMPASNFVPGWLAGLLTPDAPPLLREEVMAMMAGFHPSGYRTMAQSVAESDLRDVLPAIKVPTLLIWGEEDRRSAVAIAKAFHDAVPDSTLVLTPRSGHLSNIETPDAFNQAIRDFATN
jgi:pimeloyl-ACP methyl ester carboxylesterase